MSAAEFSLPESALAPDHAPLGLDEAVQEVAFWLVQVSLAVVPVITLGTSLVSVTVGPDGARSNEMA